MDTQSSQISSSQGFADGQNSAAKESKMSDSFLSSSPVSLIQSPQDKKGVLGSDKSTEGVATSLRFSSQPGSFPPSNYSSDTSPADEQDSPIKVSPVSERIKALEALAAKKTEAEFRGNGTFTHFRDRHNEKSITGGPKSPTEGSKTAHEGPRSAAEGPQSLTEGSKSAAESPRSQAEGPKSPAEVPRFPAEKTIQTLQKKENSADLESPESPFEILGDLKQVGEFEETEQWMKAHLPPVPDFDAAGLFNSTKSVSAKETDTDIPAAFAGVPDAFMDPIEGPKQKDEFVGEQKKTGVEEFDISFLPTAYMWDHQEKSNVEEPSNHDMAITASPAPPAEFGSTSPPSSPPICTAASQVSDEKKAIWTRELEQPEANEGDSSGESDDTVIEDHIAEPGSASSQSLDQNLNDTSTPPCTASELSTNEKEVVPPRFERKLMQVPTINVIETDEPNYSEEETEPEAEEDDDYEVVKGPDTGPPNTSEPCPDNGENKVPRARPLETEFMEGYSPPSSPVDSESEYSPKHKILNCPPETVNKTSALKSEVFPYQTGSVDLQPDKSQTISNESSNEYSPFVIENEEVDFPDNDDDWSDEAQEILFKPSTTVLLSQESAAINQPAVNEKSSTAAEEAYTKPAPPPTMSSFMQDDIYDRQSFDYDFDLSSSLAHTDVKKLNNAKERFLSDPAQNDDAEDKLDVDSAISLNGDGMAKSDIQPSSEDYPENPYSCFQSEMITSFTEKEVTKKTIANTDADNVENGNVLPSQIPVSHIQQDPKTGHNADETKSSPDRTDSGPPASEPMDSFVEFMRECLKSKKDEEADSVHQGLPYDEPCKTVSPLSQASLSMVMDFEEEHLTLNALKDLGISQEEEESVNSQSKISEQNQPKSDFTPTLPSSFSSDTKAPCSQSNPVSDSTYSSEVEAIDEWVAEAYHLAEHVLTAILTHLSGNIPSLWAVGLLTPHTPLSGTLKHDFSAEFSMCMHTPTHTLAYRIRMLT
ncbi:hypothetical protein CHARACLAT_009777 [Characodon lateralis]|uniref:Reticulon-4 n=1 Tax=Characodon lateralis TaxID=208331 RepID=A0ABU7DF55_9TELE|nr:hypothetical protein [Characodon lateralis]